MKLAAPLKCWHLQKNEQVLQIVRRLYLDKCDIAVKFAKGYTNVILIIEPATEANVSGFRIKMNETL